MEKTYKRVPFDIELAKKIQAGEIVGKIKTRDGQDVQIVLWNKNDEDGYVILALVDKPGTDIVVSYTRNGEILKGYEEELDLVLEVPDNEPQFKPFDKVLVRCPHIFIKGPNQVQCRTWIPALYYESTNDKFNGNCVMHRVMTNTAFWDECIKYEGHEHLLGTTDDPEV